jgi:hypothetical protein
MTIRSSSAFLLLPALVLITAPAVSSASLGVESKGWQEARYTQIKQVRERKKKVEKRRLEQGAEMKSVARKDPAPKRGPRRIR